MERIPPIEHWPPALAPVAAPAPARRTDRDRKQREERDGRKPRAPARADDEDDDGRPHIDVTA